MIPFSYRFTECFSILMIQQAVVLHVRVQVAQLHFFEILIQASFVITQQKQLLLACISLLVPTSEFGSGLCVRLFFLVTLHSERLTEYFELGSFCHHHLRYEVILVLDHSILVSFKELLNLVVYLPFRSFRRCKDLTKGCLLFNFETLYQTLIVFGLLFPLQS